MTIKDVGHNFGLKGWGIIGYAALLLYFMTGMTVDGLNAIVPGMATLRGWDANIILSISTPASIIALVGSAGAGFLGRELGLINATALCLALAGLFMIAYGNSANLVMYAICLTLMMTFINSFALVLGYAIVANWFPRKKGIVFGWVTMGMNLASATVVIVLTVLSHAFTFDPNGNIAHALTTLGCFLFALAVFTKLVVKATPEEAGALPDNEPYEADDLSVGMSSEQVTDRLSYAQIIKQPKTWIFGLAYGFTGIGTVGVMSQLVPYLMGRGNDQTTAIGMLTVVALIGLVGSWLWGVVDQIIGTKPATVVFGIWYAVAIMLLIADHQAAFHIGLVMIGMGIGGNGNFPPSMATGLWGRADFPNAFAVGNAIIGVVRSMAFVILAALLAAGASFSNAYLVFAVISLLGAATILLIKVRPPIAHLPEHPKQHTEIN